MRPNSFIDKDYLTTLFGLLGREELDFMGIDPETRNSFLALSSLAETQQSSGADKSNTGESGHSRRHLPLLDATRRRDLLLSAGCHPNRHHQARSKIQWCWRCLMESARNSYHGGRTQHP